jgi:hypothetical protein
MAATPANSLTLVSSGLADARLQPSLGNPDIHQFVKVVRKTTRWAAQWNRVDFDGSPEFGQRVTLTLPRIGELVNGFMIVVQMPDIYSQQLAAIQASGGTDLEHPGNFLGPTYGWTNSLGHALIQRIEIEVGGAIIETLDGRLLEMLDELYETVESSISKNAMIKRTPSGFNQRTYLTSIPTTVYIPIPFWFSRPGIHSHALPIEALRFETVRIHVTFTPVNSLIYTDARPDPRTVGFNSSTQYGNLFALQGSQFWRANPASSEYVYTMNSGMGNTPVPGEVIPGIQFSSRLSPIDAYAMIEYISLEESEAIAFRSSELTYQVEQHLPVPVQATLGQTEIRIDIPYTNPTKEILWVLQRPEAPTYNAPFLFTRDLAAPVLRKEYTGPPPPIYYPPLCDPSGAPAPPPPPPPPPPPLRQYIPWWPDAQLIPLQQNNWQVLPGFRNSYSEPLYGASLHYNSYERFVMEGASFFRSVVPSQYYVKSATINRYVYAYSFEQKNERLQYGPKGTANWDKIPRKELYLTMNRSRNGGPPPNLNVYVYITVWNILKVFGGRAGMLFSN